MSQKKSKSVLLKPYLFKNDFNVINRNALIGLLDAAISPAFEIKEEIIIVSRIFDETINNYFKKYIKRLEFLNVKQFDLINTDCEQTQFLIVSTRQYSACVLFDFSLAENPEETVFASFFNSKQTADILKILLPEEKFPVERRENIELNIAFSNLIKFIETSLQELDFNEAQKNDLETLTQSLKRDEYLAQKSRYISHEIKNHLSIIDIYTKIIEKTGGENEKIQNSTGLIFKSILNITKLLQDLKGVSEADLMVYNLSNIVNEVINSMNEMALKDNIEIKSDLKKDLNVVIDKDKFQNVLVNLIKNAVEVLKNSDKKDKYIEILSQIKDEKISLQIINNGEKIDKQYQEKIFEEGFTTKSEGSGLGLFICKQNLKEQFCELSLLKSDNNKTVFEIIMNKI